MATACMKLPGFGIASIYNRNHGPLVRALNPQIPVYIPTIYIYTLYVPVRVPRIPLKGLRARTSDLRSLEIEESQFTAQGSGV